MDYQEARKRLLHGRTGKPMPKKQVGHKRVLHHLDNWPSRFPERLGRQHAQRCVALELYRSYVLALGEKGDVVLWAGTWKTNTTMRGINDYLPRGWRVQRAWPGKHWHVRTPTGVRFFYDFMRLTAEGVDEDRKMQPSDGTAFVPDARAFEAQALDYAKELSQQFCKRTMQRWHCPAYRCIRNVNEDNEEEVRGVMYEHVQKRVPCAEIIALALRSSRRVGVAAETLIEAGCIDTARRFQTPKNNLQHAQRASDLLEGFPCGQLVLWNYRKVIWEAIRNYVLEPFGYEIT